MYEREKEKGCFILLFPCTQRRKKEIKKELSGGQASQSVKALSLSLSLLPPTIENKHTHTKEEAVRVCVCVVDMYIL